MSTNGISRLQYKRDRVLAKLELSQEKRIAQGRLLKFYDLTLLPTVPGVNSNAIEDIVNNPNIGGLVHGRPWVEETSSLVNKIGLEGGNSIRLEADADGYIILEN